jgi:hypothetical protein
MPTDRLQNCLVRLGSQPKRSAGRFFVGLLIFFAGLIGLYWAASMPLYATIIASGVMLFGLSIALYGYVGIVANRLAFFRYRNEINRERFKHLE